MLNTSTPDFFFFSFLIISFIFRSHRLNACSLLGQYYCILRKLWAFLLCNNLHVVYVVFFYFLFFFIEACTVCFIATFNCPWISCKANIAVSSSVLTSDHAAYILQYISCTALFFNVQRGHLFDKPPGTEIIVLRMLAEPHFLMPGVTCSI